VHLRDAGEDGGVQVHDGGEDGGTQLHDGGEDAGDGASSVGIQLSTGDVTFVTLDWAVSGPHMYSGTVHIGDAHSIEFVLGGIVEGSGYEITLSGTNNLGQPCSGTSAPFDVKPGVINAATVVLQCMPGSEPLAADVMTGSVSVDATVVTVDP
jgi:hypothetical protein